MFHFLIVAAAAVTSPTSSVTSDSSVVAPAVAPVVNTPSQVAAPVRPTRYCVIQQVTGSLIDQRTCHTRAEWLEEGFDPLARRH